MRYIAVLLLLPAYSAHAQGDATGLTLNLRCAGTMLGAMATGGSTTVVRDNYGNVVTGSSTSSQIVETRDVIRFRFSPAENRAFVPPIWLPPISGGERGWFEVRNLETTEAEITGRIAINFLNRVRFTIDRRSGEMRAENFTGVCEPEVEGPARF